MTGNTQRAVTREDAQSHCRSLELSQEIVPVKHRSIRYALLCCIESMDTDDNRLAEKYKLVEQYPYAKILSTKLVDITGLEAVFDHELSLPSTLHDVSVSHIEILNELIQAACFYAFERNWISLSQLSQLKPFVHPDSDDSLLSIAEAKKLVARDVWLRLTGGDDQYWAFFLACLLLGVSPEDMRNVTRTPEAIFYGNSVVKLSEQSLQIRYIFNKVAFGSLSQSFLKHYCDVLLQVIERESCAVSLQEQRCPALMYRPLLSAQSWRNSDTQESTKNGRTDSLLDKRMSFLNSSSLPSS